MLYHALKYSDKALFRMLSSLTNKTHCFNFLNNRKFVCLYNFRLTHLLTINVNKFKYIL